MMRKLLIAGVWFPLTLALLAADLYILTTITRKPQTVTSASFRPPVPVAASSYGTEQVLGASVKAGDARVMLLEQFLRTHQSPLADYAPYILDRADYYQLDFRLISAIAMCESNVGKRMPSKASHNAWGISVETGETSGANFKNWLSAIDWVSRYMKQKYYDRGISELIDIGAIYAPPSVENGNSWANCVQHFMDQIQ